MDHYLQKGKYYYAIFELEDDDNEFDKREAKSPRFMSFDYSNSKASL